MINGFTDNKGISIFALALLLLTGCSGGEEKFDQSCFAPSSSIASMPESSKKILLPVSRQINAVLAPGSALSVQFIIDKGTANEFKTSLSNVVVNNNGDLVGDNPFSCDLSTGSHTVELIKGSDPEIFIILGAAIGSFKICTF